MKKAIAAVALLIASVSSAFAATTVTLTPGVTGVYTGFFGASHTAGAFTDVYNFTPSLGGTWVDSLITSIGFTPASDINFTLADLNGSSLIIQNGLLDAAYTPAPFQLSGPLTLTISGMSGATASYSGSINVTSAVPEPETYAMLLAGLGLVGFAARRRKAVTAA
jgi:hypothetical protein